HFPPLTLTALYASYAAGGLVALLMTGRLADFVGRRIVLGAGLAVECLAMLVFAGASDVGGLFLGRILSGIGVGIGVGAVSAWLIDLAPASNRALGSLVGGVGVLLGLGTGALVAGAFVQYGPDPLRFVYWLFAGAFVAGLAAILAIGDPAARRPGWLASM